MAVRKKREEKLSETNINKVIELLAAEKPITIRATRDFCSLSKRADFRH